MLFNSYVFVLGFLPITLALFFTIAKVDRRAARHFLLIASFLFYAWWSFEYGLVIVATIVVNFFLGRKIQELADHRAKMAKPLLVIAVAANVALLSYFKYRNFFIDNFNMVTGSNWEFAPLVLPLAISFHTFQQIAYLVDSYHRKVDQPPLPTYALFVLFFPQLIAGPIVHHYQLLPQLKDMNLPHPWTCPFRKPHPYWISRRDRLGWRVMLDFLKLFAHVLASPFKSQARLEAEIVVLRQQLMVLRRRVPSKPKLTVADRLLFVWLCRLFPSVLNAMAIVQPETVMRWHRLGFRLYWRWKSRCRGGRPRVPVEIRSLIREMSLANRLWGAPRIHGELLKLGIEVAQSTVAKYMARSGRGPSQTWKTFLRNHAAGIGAMDFLIVPTVGFRLLFVLVILRHQRRRLISLSVTPNPTAEWIARQLTEAFPWNEAPDCLIRDRDGSYGQAVTRRLAAMGIRDHPTAARSPWQNGHAERLIGSIRRECLDHIVVFGEGHLRLILAAYSSYYNGLRTHLSLDKDSPFRRPMQRFGEAVARPILGGLHHEYCRM